jgi:hypothetical protein
MLLAWKAQGIIVFAGYILGFPADTPASIRRDIEIIKRELPHDILEFFCLTPLPGSEDHQGLWRKGVAMDPDLNKYDLEHVVTDHPVMSRAEWKAIYDEAWSIYYSPEHFETLFRRAAVTKVPLMSLAKVLIQLKAMVQIEKLHPLQSGILRMRHPSERRPTLPPLNIVAFYARYIRDLTVRNFLMAKTILSVLAIKRRVERDPNRMAYHDQALTPVDDEHDEESFDYLNKTAGAKAAIEHIRKVAALTH